MVSSHSRRPVTLAVVVAALGYFVDIYDLILFGTVRKASLQALGYVSPEALAAKGVLLFNMQMGGMLVGGVLWGMLGDKRGRLSVLFGSIIMYSIANIANAQVHSLEMYMVWRAIAGIGLAGELGAGITLVSELMDKEKRGIATAIVAGVGVIGGVAAGIVGGGIPWLWHGVDWRWAYRIGGIMGFALLLLRIGVTESGMFRTAAAASHVERGNFFALFKTRERFLRYLAVICVGVPVWYVVAILVTFSDRVGGAMHISPAPAPATCLMLCYAGLALGDVCSGMASQLLRSRRKAFGIFITGVAIAVAALLGLGIAGALDTTTYYVMCVVLGIPTGYWAVFVTAAAEQFGTNLRATVATTSPNFVRGSAVLLTSGFLALTPALGIVGAVAATGAFSLGVAFLGLMKLRETFGVDLDYLEE
ncbi:MAG TPA: MFS transporter [Kofleriaceae bacterium]